jgi:uncharacterized membrane protein YczE
MAKLTLSRRGWGGGVGVAWTIAEVFLLLIDLALGGTIGPGSILFAVLIGPTMELAFWLLRVERRGDLYARRPAAQPVA